MKSSSPPDGRWTSKKPQSRLFPSNRQKNGCFGPQLLRGKKKPRWLTRGLLAGSSWLLHIKQIYIKKSGKTKELVLKGVRRKGKTYFVGRGVTRCVKVDSPLHRIAARGLKKNQFF